MALPALWDNTYSWLLPSVSVSVPGACRTVSSASALAFQALNRLSSTACDRVQRGAMQIFLCMLLTMLSPAGWAFSEMLGRHAWCDVGWQHVGASAEVQSAARSCCATCGRACRRCTCAATGRLPMTRCWTCPPTQCGCRGARRASASPRCRRAGPAAACLLSDVIGVIV